MTEDEIEANKKWFQMEESEIAEGEPADIGAPAAAAPQDFGGEMGAAAPPPTGGGETGGGGGAETTEGGETAGEGSM